MHGICFNVRHNVPKTLTNRSHNSDITLGQRYTTDVTTDDATKQFRPLVTPV
jgi:hypothetical protein